MIFFDEESKTYSSESERQGPRRYLLNIPYTETRLVCKWIEILTSLYGDLGENLKSSDI